MGRPRIKTIDDSVSENQESRIKNKAKKSSKKNEEGSEGRLPLNAASSRVRRQADRTRGDEPQGAVSPQRDAVSEQESVAADRSEKPSEPMTAGATDRNKKPQKPGKAKPRSKKYQETSKDLDRTKSYSLDEAVDMAKKLSYAKFNATLEAHINTAQTGIRGLISLPYASGRKLNILIFGPSQTPKLEGVVFGSDSTIEDISHGKVDFDLIITTPEWMPKLAKVAKILGPRGLMPNPKNGTITDDLKKTVESFQAGKTEYKTESKAPVIHIVMGKLNQPTEELSANIKTLLQTLGKTRVKQVRLAPTMGPGVKVDLASI